MHGLGKRFGDREYLGRGAILAQGLEILGEGHGVHLQKLDPADRKGDLGEREFQQRARGDDVQLRAFLKKIPQRHDRPGAALDLIKEQERFARHYPALKRKLQLREQFCGAQVP